MTIVTYVAAVLATLFLVVGLSSANGAPQEAAAAAVSLAIVAIPYCVTATIQRARIIDLNRSGYSD